MNAQTQTAEAQQTALTVAAKRPEMIVVQDTSSFANLLDTGKFEHMWRVARTFAASKMVPTIFQDKPEDCFVAIQMAVRLDVDPFMFMQNTYPAPGGKPAMEGKLAIALINARGPFRGGVQFRFDGKGDAYGCTAYGIHKDDGKERAVTVTIKIAKDEGWYGRNKKWQTMPDQMLIYRSGAWLGRAFCPEVLMGMRTLDEAEDIGQLREGADGIYAPANLPPRPTRAGFSSAGNGAPAAKDVRRGPVAVFEFVGSTGEFAEGLPAHSYATVFIAEMHAAATEADVQGIWETNSPSLDSLRAIGPEGEKLAEEIHAAYNEELDAKKKAERLNAKASKQGAKIDTPEPEPEGDPRPEPPIEDDAGDPDEGNSTQLLQEPADDKPDDGEALYSELYSELVAKTTAADIHAWNTERSEHVKILKAGWPDRHEALIEAANERIKTLSGSKKR